MTPKLISCFDEMEKDVCCRYVHAFIIFSKTYFSNMTTSACIVTLRILKKAMSMYSIPNNDLNLVPSETIYFSCIYQYSNVFQTQKVTLLCSRDNYKAPLSPVSSPTMIPV